MRLIGLDFETANPCNGSICAVGVAVLADGMIVQQREWRIKPHPSVDWVAPQFTQIHGINYYDLRSALEFPAIWPVLSMMLQAADCVVIHHAVFDLRHLRAVLHLYHLVSDPFDYVCSLEISRKIFPQMPSHALNCVAGAIGHQFQHHDALADATACATIIAHTGIPENTRKQFVYDNHMV